MGTRDDHIDLRPLWTTKELAAFMGVPVATVYEWNYRRSGPRFVKVGRYIRFRPRDIETWLREQEVGDHSPASASRDQERRGGPAVRPETRPAAATTRRRRTDSESNPNA